MSEGLDKLAGGVGKAIEAVPDLYDDALKPSTQESGEVLALIPRTIKAALLPLRQWIAEREYKLAETEKLLAKKLENVGEDKIVTPEAYVAVPAIQAISYSMDSKELRNLYANLLAKAMNSDTKNSVHPAFVEIIKQLSPIDAVVLKKIMERDFNPLIDIIKKNAKGDFAVVSTNVSDIFIAPVETICLSINNFTRQGLISIPEGNFYSDNTYYEKILSSKYYRDIEKEISNTAGEFKLSYKKHLILKTSLGQSFYKSCISNE